MVVQFGRLPIYHPMAGSVIDDLFGGFLNGGWDLSQSGLIPLDVVESGNEVVVLAEIPGVKKDDVRVTLHDGVLTISGEKMESGLPDGSHRHRAERGGGPFSRSLELPAAVDASAVSAELKNGILRIVIPKAEEARPREIRVN